MDRRLRVAAGSAWAFILLMGIVSMFSDMTHESANSILGAFLSLAGASATTIGFVSGLGMCLGYALRLFSGWLADRTHQYWTICIVGYILDLIFVPLLALVPDNGWVLACSFVIMERVGKALKKPSKDTLISFAAKQAGAGKSFGIQEFLDQMGAFLGPIILYAILLWQDSGSLIQDYRVCFAVLAIPAVVTILLLFYARNRFPNPENFEPETKETAPFRLNRTFIIYIIGISVFAAGFLDFPLITMHVLNNGLMSSDELPLLYALAMGVDAVAAILCGYLYDRLGIATLIIPTAIAAPFVYLIFGMTSFPALIAGVVLWGVGMGAQESILKSAVTSIVPKKNRSTGFGIFETSFGICWFLGSWLAGWLYDNDLTLMIVFCLVTQLASIPFYLGSARLQRKAASA